MAYFQTPNWINLLPSAIQIEIRSRMYIKKFYKDEILHHRKDTAEHLYELRRGKLIVCTTLNDGDDFWLAQLVAGDTFGEAGLIDEKTRTNTVVATTESDVALLSKGDFNELRDNYSGIDRALLTTYIGYCRQINEALSDIGILNVRQRLVKLLHKMARECFASDEAKVVLDGYVSQEGLGKMLGASRQSVSKELLNLQNKGVIEICREKLVVLQFDVLESMANEIEVQ